MLEKIFGLIFLGILSVIGIVLLIKFTIWSYKAEKEIEEMEKQLDQIREQEITEEEIVERLASLNKKERAELKKALKELMKAIGSIK